MELAPVTAIQKAFPGLPEEDVQELLSVARVRSYPPGVILCHEGRVEETFYVVVSGQVEMSKQLDYETHRTLAHTGPGGFFGEIALVQKGPRTATVRTVRLTEVLEIDRATFDAMLERSPRMAMPIIQHVARRLRDADQKAIGDLRQKNVELARAYADLERQQQLRSEFLTTVSHELRTPLTAATGYLNLIRSGLPNPEQQLEMLAAVTRNVDTVVHLVNTILFMQELDLIAPEFRPVDVGELALAALQSVREQATRAGIRLQVQVEPGLPQIEGGAMELERAVVVLLENAIKFSPDGGEVRLEVFSQGDRVGISVSDPGIGIPPDELDHIFEPFTRARPPEGQLFGGIGLGLPIARHVVELHGGRIDVVSREGEGSTFTVLLPVH